MKTYRARVLFLASSLVLLLSLGLGAAAVEADSCVGTFPPTGQTTSFAASTQTATGAPVNDDGAVQAGGALSYQDNGDGTITDLNTGLMWEKKSLDGSAHDANRMFLWSALIAPTEATIWDWLDALNATSFAGYNDWRIPNLKELESILNFGYLDTPAVDPVFNNGVTVGCDVFTCSVTGGDDNAGGAYWSSTTLGGRSSGTGGYTVQFFHSSANPFAPIQAGEVLVVNKAVIRARVRAVRGCV